MKLIRFSLFVVLMFVVATGAFAQTTSNLTGTVTSAGSGLPGVTVTITSPQLQGSRTAVTGEGGAYSFAALPPGAYTVTFDLSGMKAVTKTQQLQLGTTSRVDADLKVAGVSEAITVTASAPSVLETPQVATNLTLKEVERLPVARNQVATALLAPGVNDSTFSASQFQISGSPGYDNLVLVNGVVVSENIRSQARPLYIEDAIQETTIMTGAISAEYGRFTGGVVNTITKSGGNDFSGSFRDSLSNAAWVAQTPANETRRKHVNQIYEGTLGGFVMRDRLWFFGAGRKAKTNTPLTTVAIPSSPNSAASPLLSYDQASDTKRYEAKLTGQITPKHTLIGSYLKIQSQTAGDRFQNAIYDLESTSTRSDPESLKSLHYNGIITSNLLIEGQYSKRDQAFVGSGAKFTDIVKGTLLLDRNNGNARFNSPTFCGVCDTETRNNNEYLVKGNYFLNTRALGAHNFVGGIDRFEEQRYANNHQSGSDFRLFVTQAKYANGQIYPVITPSTATGGGSFIRWTPIFVGANESNLRTDSLFINDKWDINNHLTVNIGARYDKNDAVDGSGNTTSKDSRITPRLGAYYDIKGDGRHRVSLSYGQYASHIVEGIASSNSSAGQPATIDLAYNGPSINATTLDTPMPAAIAAVFAYFNSIQGGVANVSNNLRPTGAISFPGFAATFPSALRSPVVDEITLGYGAQIGSRGFAKVDLISRKWHDFYAAQVDSTTPHIASETLPNGTVFNIPLDEIAIVNSDGIHRKYEGVQFQARYNPSRFQAGVNYTYAKLKGNAEVENSTSGPGAVIDFGHYYPEYLDYANFAPEGYLAGDVRHRLRAWVGMDVPMPRLLGTVNVSVLHNYDSGTPYSAVGSINARTAPGVAATPTFYKQSSAGTYYFGERGAYRLPNVKSTALALRWAYPIGRAEFFAQGDVLNIFNKHDIIPVNGGPGVNTTIFTSTTAGRTYLQAFNPATTVPKECPAFSIHTLPSGQQINAPSDATDCPASAGYNFQKSNTFGTLVGGGSTANYQTPRTVRMSFGVRF
jgi:hypothetical protein